MSWDFSGEQPEIIVYETQADVPQKFRANLIERGRTGNPQKTTIKFWNIYFDAATYEGAIKRADLWWLDHRAKHDAAEEAKAKRSAEAAIAREQKAAAKVVQNA
ncbi:MAG: hypothetical protein CFE27_14725 [Alphaproteobacteria bacterium PA1]|nr:MAG: hypothetical protein CFE27_14725 [Alphaproteobacteria bacterium PA1]